jgi:tRNA G46 methylase TrmB
VKKSNESNFYRDRETSMNEYPKWTISLLHHDLIKGFFIALSFSSMISTGYYGIPLVSNIFSNKSIDLNNVVFAVFSLLGWIWGFMAYNQFDRFTKLVKNTWSLSHKLDPLIGEYDYKTFNPETNQWEEGYTHFGILDFWDSENEVPRWLDKAKYWNIFIELQRINKNTLLQITNDKNLPFKEGKKNLTITFKGNNFNNKINNAKSTENKAKKYRVIIPQWLVINTEYRDFNSNFQLEINTITSTIGEINKNIPKIIDEIVQMEKTIMIHRWNIFISLFLYLNKSLPLRIVYSKIKGLSPGAKKRRIQYINDNLSRVSINDLIEAIIIKAKMIGFTEKSLAKLLSLIKFLKNEYDKLGLGEGSSEYHNLHHSLEVAYMSLNMLPKEIHSHIIQKEDYEIMLVAALLHDYNPMHDIKYRKLHSRIPRVTNTLEKIRKMRIHDAYFSFSDEGLIKYFRKNGSPLIPTQEFATVHPQYLENKESKIESKIVEALIWRTDFPFDETSQNNFNQLFKEIKNSEYNCDKINLIAEVLSLADLSVTYLSSDPLLAWNRVIKLYQELDLPIVEAVASTDRFLSLFSEESLFKEIINRKNFPITFRQKWDNVYRFFHEGNPSNRINKIIMIAKTKYQKINMEIYMKNCDFLISKAILFKNEFFLGIGRDKENIITAQTKIKLSRIENMEVIPGNIEKLLPFIKDKSIDNLILNISDEVKTDSAKVSFMKDIFYLYSTKLVPQGTIQLITLKNQNYDEIKSLIPTKKFKIISIYKNLGSKDTVFDNSINSNKLEDIEIITIANLDKE